MLRCLAAICALLFALATTGWAQTVYPSAPDGLATPRDGALESARAMQGNLARWRDSERARLGPYRLSDREPYAPIGAIGEVGGYFAIFGGERSPPGVAHGIWRDSDSAVGERSMMRLTYVTAPTVCGAPRLAASADIGELSYLGPALSEALLALNETLGGDNGQARRIDGPTLGPDAPTPPFESQPTYHDFSRFYPLRALEREQQGAVFLMCRVLGDRSLICGVANEDPPGWGFGEAALRIMENSRVRVVPTLGDGALSVGYCLQRRVRFALPS